MALTVHFEVLNQLGTPMMHSATLANRPAAGITGRIFFRTDSPFGIYRDTGSAWDQISGSSTFSGSLTAGQVAYGSATDTIAGNNNLFWNSANNRLGIGTNTPQAPLQVVGSALATAFGSSLFYSTGSDDLGLGTQGGTIGLSVKATTRNTQIYTGVQPGDNGYRLQVIGNTYLKGSGTDGSTLALLIQNSSSVTSFSVNNAGTAIVTAPTNTEDNNPLLNLVRPNLGKILTIRDRASIEIGNNNFIYPTTGDINATISRSTSGLFIGQTDGTTTTGNAWNVSLGRPSNINNIYDTSTTGGLAQVIGQFNPTTGTAPFTAFRIIPTINQTGGSNGITRGLHIDAILTAATDWRSIEWSNNTGFGLYGAGTAANYLGGSLGIKTTAIYSPSTFSLDVNGGLLIKNTAGTTAQLTIINADPSLGGNNGFLVNTVGGTSGSSYVDLQGYYGTSITGSTALRLNPAGGPVIINSTTNSGEQVQITGSLRVNGQLSPTMGTPSGQHLIINCDGTLYKINLFNP